MTQELNAIKSEKISLAFFFSLLFLINDIFARMLLKIINEKANFK